MSTKELLEQRAGLIAEAQKIMDATEQRSMTSEDEERFDKLMADADAIDAQVRGLKRKDQLAAATKSLEQPVGRIASAARAAAKHDVDEYRTAFNHYLRSGDNSELRAMSIGTSSAGGYTVPETTEARVVEKLYQASVMRQLGTVRSTPDDRKIPIEGSTLGTASIISEAGNISATDVDFDQKTVEAYKYATAITASRELLDDSGFDLESYLLDKLSLRIARAQDEHFWDGTDSGMPQGVIQGLTGASQKKQLGGTQTTAITSADDIIDWIYTLPVQYRQGAVILTSDEVIKNLRKLKDSVNNYIWQPTYTEQMMTQGAPGTIMGYPYYISEYVDAMAADKYVGVFGNFRYYEIFDRGATEILVDPYSLSTSWQIRMTVVRRSDAVRTNDDAFKTLQMQ